MDDLQNDVLPGARGIPRIGAPAVPFRMRTTHGERALADYAGHWLLLIAHPADFTPVCTSEFIGFSKAHDRFRELGCDLLGFSVDSVFSHLAWLRSIAADFGVAVPFPVGEDLSMAVASAYGMIHPADGDTATVRGSVFIDPAGTIRLITYYPMAIGRSVEEHLRVLEALQQADASGRSMPAGWRPGEAALLPPPLTVDEAAARMRQGAASWYCATAGEAGDAG